MQSGFSLVWRKFSEQASDKSTGREIRKGFLAIEILHFSGKFLEVQLKYRHALGLVCVKSDLSEEPLKVIDPPF